MAVCLTLSFCIISLEACRMQWGGSEYDLTHNRIATQARNVAQLILYSRHCAASLLLPSWVRNAPRPPSPPWPDPASVSSIFRLHHYLFRADSSVVMGLITPLLCEAADGCTGLPRVREKLCRPTRGTATDPAGSFNTAQGLWPLRGVCGQHITWTFLKL